MDFRLSNLNNNALLMNNYCFVICKYVCMFVLDILNYIRFYVCSYAVMHVFMYIDYLCVTSIDLSINK